MAEPDGIYGLLRSHALPIQLRLYEHEGAWGQALTGHDLTLRTGFGSGGGGGGGGGVESRQGLALVPPFSALNLSTLKG